MHKIYLTQLNCVRRWRCDRMKTENMAKLSGAAMAIGVAAAVTAGVISAKSSPKSKMKKMAKKSIKAMDGIMSAMK